MKFKATYLWAILVLGLAGYTYWDYRKTAGGPELEKGERLAFSVKREDVTAIKFTRGTDKVELKKEGDEWRLLAPVQDWAEDSIIDGFLFGIMNEKVRGFREDDTKPDWTKYGLVPPGVRIELATPKITQVMEISSKNAFDGSFYVRQGEELVAGASSLAQTTNRTVNSFRSRRIWRHADAEVTRVEADYGVPAENFSAEKVSGVWTLRPTPKFPVDAARIEHWVTAVEDLSAAEFVRDGTEDLKPYGLDRPRLKVGLDYHAEGEAPGRWELRVGREQGGDAFFYTNDRATILKAPVATTRKILATPEYFRDGRVPFKFDAEAAREVRVRSGKLNFRARKDGATWTLVDAKDGRTLDEAEFKELVGTIGTLHAVDFPGRAVEVKGPPAVEILDQAGHPLLTLAFGADYTSKVPWNEKAAPRAVRVNGGETFGLPKAQIENLIKERLIKEKTPASPTKTGAASHP